MVRSASMSARGSLESTPNSTIVDGEPTARGGMRFARNVTAVSRVRASSRSTDVTRLCGEAKSRRLFLNAELRCRKGRSEFRSMGRQAKSAKTEHLPVYGENSRCLRNAFNVQRLPVFSPYTSQAAPPCVSCFLSSAGICAHVYGFQAHGTTGPASDCVLENLRKRYTLTPV